MRRVVTGLASAMLVLAACGGGGGGGGSQDEVADKLLEQADAAGFDLDEDCVRDKASQLSDEDADKLLEAADDDDPELSPEGEELTISLFECVQADAFIDEIVASLPEGVDADCVRDALEGVDLAEMAETGTPPAEFAAAMSECVSTG